MNESQSNHTFTVDADLGVYAVAFLDLLGQKAAMRALEPAFEPSLAVVISSRQRTRRGYAPIRPRSS